MPNSQLKAVVLDWAGTVIDHGSLAPMGVFVRAFAHFGVDITVDEARGPMGMAKRDHIQAVMNLPRIADAWRARHGAAPAEADVDRVYDVFVPLNVEVVTDYATLIDGVAEVTARLRARGLRIGSTTGYTREIMAPLLPLAAAAGLCPRQPRLRRRCGCGPADAGDDAIRPFSIWGSGPHGGWSRSTTPRSASPKD